MRKASSPANYVTLLTELCEEYGLEAVQYEMKLIAGPCNHPTYVVTARIGMVERTYSGPTIKIATQLAAEQIYRHLRTKLGASAKYFNEDDEMVRAYEQAMIRNKKLEESIAIAENPDLDDDEKRRLTRNLMKSHSMVPPPSQNAMDVVSQSIRLELDQREFYRPPGLTGNVQKEEAPGAAMVFIERTMEELGL